MAGDLRDAELLATVACRPPPPPSGPIYERPREVGHYSWRAGCPPLPDRSSLRAYVPPNGTRADGTVADGDLNRGFPRRFVKHKHVLETLDALERAAERLRAGDPSRRLGTSLHAPDFVTWRGILRSFVTAPYNPRQGWELEARLDERGAVHVRPVGSRPRGDNDGEVEDAGNLTRFEYYGYKFEAMCGVELGRERDPLALAGRDDAAVDTRDQFCSVITSRLGPHRLLFAAEIDAVLPVGRGGDASGAGEGGASEDSIGTGSDNFQSRYVELKTTVDWEAYSRERAAGRERAYYRHRMHETWAQCYLAGVPNVVVGLRAEDGRLRRVLGMRTRDIPRRAAGLDPRGAWRADLGLAFAADLLGTVRGCVRETSGGWRYRLVKEPAERSAGSVIRVYDLGDSGGGGRAAASPA